MRLAHLQMAIVGSKWCKQGQILLRLLLLHQKHLMTGQHGHLQLLLNNQEVMKIIARATDWFGNVKTVKIPVTILLTDNNLNSTTLTLNTISSIPWNNTVTITGALTDNNSSGAGIGGKTITFTGTGATSLAIRSHKSG